MEETILNCQDSAEGILTAVYRAYEWKLPRDRVSIRTGAVDLCLFASCRDVETRPDLAKKVSDTIKRRFGRQVWEDLSFAMAACDERKGTAVLRTIDLGLSGRIRGRLTQGLGEEWIRIVFELGRRVRNEYHRQQEFLRFRQAQEGYLFALTEPKEDVTAFLMPHFSDRLPMENFVIVDSLRGIAGVHPAGRPWVLLRLNEEEKGRMAGAAGHTSQEEAEAAELFRCFCRTVSIRERENPGLQRQHLPLRFRGTMTEFDPPGQNVTARLQHFYKKDMDCS